jgi:hypothetical protein
LEIEALEAEQAAIEVRLSDRQLAEVADELGIAPAAFSSALAEHRAGGIDRGAGGRIGWSLDRLAGPRHVVGRRLSEGELDRLEGRLSEWLTVTHGFRTDRLDGGVLVARQGDDGDGVLPTVVGRVQGRSGLSVADEVRAVVVADDQGSAVCLVADLGAKRQQAVTSGSLAALGGTAVVGVVAVVTTPVTLVAVPVAFGLGVAVARWRHQRTLRRVNSSVEDTLDAAVRDEAAPRVLGLRRLLGPTRPGRRRSR